MLDKSQVIVYNSLAFKFIGFLVKQKGIEMAKKVRTTHTIFGQVSSHGSGGRIDILAGHPAVMVGFTSETLTTKLALGYAMGQHVIVRLMLSGKRRATKMVHASGLGIDTVDAFDKRYDGVLRNEKIDYIRKMGGEFVEHPTTKSPEYVHPELKSEIMTKSTWTEKPVTVDVSEWLEKIYIDEKDNELLNTIKKLAEKRHVAVMMVGPSGYGKTSIPQQKAADWNMEFLRWDCATVRDPEEFFGFRGAIDGSTMTEDGKTLFAESDFTKTLEAGNCIIVLDELNRIDPYISNILFPLLDHAGKTTVAGHEIIVGQNVIFFATVNLGFQFTGTFTLDTALNNRFTAKVLVNALPREIEAKIIMARGGIDLLNAQKIVKLMSGLRSLNAKDQLSIDCSTRVSIQMAELIGCGLDFRNALVYVIINGISDDEAKLVIDQFGLISG